MINKKFRDGELVRVKNAGGSSCAIMGEIVMVISSEWRVHDSAYLVEVYSERRDIRYTQYEYRFESLEKKIKEVKVYGIVNFMKGINAQV